MFGPSGESVESSGKKSGGGKWFGGLAPSGAGMSQNTDLRNRYEEIGAKAVVFVTLPIGLIVGIQNARADGFHWGFWGYLFLSPLLIGIAAAICVALVTALIRPMFRKNGYGHALWAFAIVIGLFDLGGIAVGPTTSNHQQTAQVPAPSAATSEPAAATDGPTDRPAPVDRHDERAKIQTYWKSIIDNFAMAGVTGKLAAAAAVNGNLVQTMQLLRRDADSLELARQAIHNSVPDGWGDVTEALEIAANSMQTGMKKMQTYIDEQRPSQAADAIDSAQHGRDAFYEAVHRARVHYIAMGGRGEDVSDASAETDNLMEAVKLLMGGH